MNATSEIATKLRTIATNIQAAKPEYSPFKTEASANIMAETLRELAKAFDQHAAQAVKVPDDPTFEMVDAALEAYERGISTGRDESFGPKGMTKLPIDKRGAMRSAVSAAFDMLREELNGVTK